jgi:uncharacterized repeat protein (TIGR01451 family)
VNGKNVNWTLLNVQPGETKLILLNASVTTIPTACQNTTNNLFVRGVPPNGDNVTATTALNVTVCLANLSVIKVDATPVLTSPGGLVQWLINVSNPGEVTLNPVFVTDTLPNGFQYSAANIAPGSISPDNRTMNWTNVGPINPGAYVLIRLNSSVNAGIANGSYTNIVSVIGKPPNGDNVSDSDNPTIGIYVPAINLVKTVLKSQVRIGEKNRFRLNVTNTGSINITITAVDVLPAYLTFIEADVAPTNVSGQTITWANFTVLQPGQSTAINYNVSTTNPDRYYNNATVTGVPPNGNSVNDNDSATFIAFKTPVEREKTETLSISLYRSCLGNVVTVSSGKPVQDAEVKLNGDLLGTTNSSGQIIFEGCGFEAGVTASKTGFVPGTLTKRLLTCEACVQCTEDADCADNEYCSGNACLPVECDCGSASGHRCEQYACCSDSDCAKGEACAGHACIQKFECANDADCAPAKYCDIAPGAEGGSCRNVTGQCGQIVGHTFVPYNYECGSESGCPSCPQGRVCIQHGCVEGELISPVSGFVGGNVTIKANEEGKTCAFCNVEIVAPDGKKYYGRTDAYGNFNLPLGLTGVYTVNLLKDGTILRSIKINSMPAAARPEEGLKLTTENLACLAAIVLVAILALVAWKRRKKDRRYETAGGNEQPHLPP